MAVLSPILLASVTLSAILGPSVSFGHQHRCCTRKTSSRPSFEILKRFVQLDPPYRLRRKHRLPSAGSCCARRLQAVPWAGADWNSAPVSRCALAGTTGAVVCTFNAPVLPLRATLAGDK